MDNNDQADVVGSKVFHIPSGKVSINPYITQMVDTIKPIIRTLVEEANLVRDAICRLFTLVEYNFDAA